MAATAARMAPADKATPELSPSMLSRMFTALVTPTSHSRVKGTLSQGQGKRSKHRPRATATLATNSWARNLTWGRSSKMSSMSPIKNMPLAQPTSTRLCPSRPPRSSQPSRKAR